MKVACQVCNKVIDTYGVFKGSHAYGFTVGIETEPYISTACARIEEGYLCHDCQNELARFLKYNKR